MKQADKPHWLIKKELCENSKLNLEVDKKSQTVKIEIHGKLSSIPAIKNRKQIVFNRIKKTRSVSITKGAMCKLYAMDELYERELERLSIKGIHFGDAKIFVYLICGKRGRSFDPINCMETVCDWLEPNNKKHGGKERGWGIGITSDDKLITPFAVHSKDIGKEIKHSTVIIRPWKLVKENCLEFLNSSF